MRKAGVGKPKSLFQTLFQTKSPAMSGGEVDELQEDQPVRGVS